MVNKTFNKKKTGMLPPPHQEVYPDVLVGSRFAAKHVDILQDAGVTAVINMAEGKGYGMVDTNAEFYREGNISQYLGYSPEDYPSSDVYPYFHKCARFIHKALKSGGRVAVVSYYGSSRSATIVCAFLMLRRNMLAKHAIMQLYRNRKLNINFGFLCQLANLDNELRY